MQNIDEKTISNIIWLTVACALSYLIVVFWQGWQDVVKALDLLGTQTLILGGILSMSTYIWRFTRWDNILQRMNYKLPKFRQLIIYLSGFALTATPGKAGEALRTGLLSAHGVIPSHSLAALLIDRGTDVIGITLLGLLAAVISNTTSDTIWIVLFSAVLGGSLGIALIINNKPNLISSDYTRGRGFKLPFETLKVWASQWNHISTAVYIILAMIAYGTQGVVFFIFCDVMELKINLPTAVLTYVMATLFGAISFLPAGIGAVEATLMLQLINHGADTGTAVALTIAIRLITVWQAIVIGLIAIIYLRKKSNYV